MAVKNVAMQMVTRFSHGRENWADVPVCISPEAHSSHRVALYVVIYVSVSSPKLQAPWAKGYIWLIFRFSLLNAVPGQQLTLDQCWLDE